MAAESAQPFSPLVDVFLVEDMRRHLFSFMGWDEYINLSNICKNLNNVISGRAVNNSERRQVFGRLVISPFMRAFKCKYPTQSFYWMPTAEQKETQKKKHLEERRLFKAWQKLPLYTRFLTLHEMYETNMHAGSDLGQSYDMAQINVNVWRDLPIAEVMNIPVDGCMMVVQEEDVCVKLSRVTMGSVIHRLMWSLQDYPHWVKFLLNGPMRSEAQEILNELKLKLTSVSGWMTPLMLPHNIAGVCTLRRGVPNYSKTKPLLKKEQELHMKQQANVSNLIHLYEQQLWRVDMAMQTEIMVPKIRAHLQGVSPLQDTDLEEIMKALKRVSGRDTLSTPSKRRRVVGDDDDLFND